MKKQNIIFVLLSGLLMISLSIRAQYPMPGYLKGYETVWKSDPKEAAMKWFKDAGFGMFVHFSPATTLPKNTDYSKLDPWFKVHGISAKLDEYRYKQHLLNKLDNIAPEVEKLITSFNPADFDAERIADLAVSAGMKYITFTSQHVSGRLFMFDTSISRWNSKLTINRDFVKELSDACEKRGLGLFLYVMPPHDLLYPELKQMFKEILTNYGAIAGVWFDGIWECYNRPNDYLEIGKLYKYINELQPQCLISFKTGFTGDEDFLAPEWHQLKFENDGSITFPSKVPNDEKILPIIRISKKDGLIRKYQSFKDTWEKELINKPMELCATMIKGNIWFDEEGGVHKTREEVLSEYNHAKKNKANYLLNVAPRKDGSIHPKDKEVLDGFKTYIK